MDNPNTFYIDFDTESNPGKIGAVKVTLEYEEIADMERPLNIALPSHPLYPQLLRFVAANPEPIAPEREK